MAWACSVSKKVFKVFKKYIKLFLIIGITFVFFCSIKLNFRTEYITENVMEDKDSKNPMKKALEVNICGMEFFFFSNT